MPKTLAILTDAEGLPKQGQTAGVSVTTTRPTLPTGVPAIFFEDTDPIANAVNGDVWIDLGATLDVGEAFPVGSVFISVVSTNPATLLGYGTWSAIAAGRVLVGLDSGDSAFDTVEETGGAKTHTLTTGEMPAHTHDQMRYPTATGGSTGFTVDTSMSGTPATANPTGSTGGGGAHNNVQPYFVVYMWKRTA